MKVLNRMGEWVDTGDVTVRPSQLRLFLNRQQGLLSSTSTAFLWVGAVATILSMFLPCTRAWIELQVGIGLGPLSLSLGGASGVQPNSPLVLTFWDAEPRRSACLLVLAAAVLLGRPVIERRFFGPVIFVCAMAACLIVAASFLQLVSRLDFALVSRPKGMETLSADAGGGYPSGTVEVAWGWSVLFGSAVVLLLGASLAWMSVDGTKGNAEQGPAADRPRE